MESDFMSGFLAGQGEVGSNGGGFFGNEGLWAVIILAIIFGWGNGGAFGGGNSGGGSFPTWISGNDTRAAVTDGFAMNGLSEGIRGVQNGLCSLGYDQLAQLNGINSNIASGFNRMDNAVCTLGYQNAQLINGLENTVQSGFMGVQAGQTALSTQIAQCCCDTKSQFADLKYTIATEDCATRQAIADSSRAIMDNCNRNYRELMDYITQDKIATLTAENQSLKFGISQQAQTEAIVGRLSPCPNPAYIVPAPYPYGYNGNCNSCC